MTGPEPGEFQWADQPAFLTVRTKRSREGACEFDPITEDLRRDFRFRFDDRCFT